jgi:hypothetical protein
MVERLTWTVVGDGLDPAGVSALVLGELPTAIRKLIPSVAEAHVTIQDAEQFSEAVVDLRDKAMSIDAVIEVETTEACCRLDAFQEYLRDTGVEGKAHADIRLHSTEDSWRAVEITNDFSVCSAARWHDMGTL